MHRGHSNLESQSVVIVVRLGSRWDICRLVCRNHDLRDGQALSMLCRIDDNKRSNIFYTQNLNDHLVGRSVLCPQSITSLSQSNGGKQSEYLALTVKLSKCDRYFNPGAEIRGWFQSKAHRDAGSFAQYCLFALEICVPAASSS